MNVEGAAALVTLRDTGEAQVAVEDTKQSGGDVKDGQVGRQSGRNGNAVHPGLGLQPGEFVGQPLPQVVGQVVAQRQGVALPVLFVGGIQLEKGNLAVEL